MRVALIADVHGNLPALEAVLAEIEREQPDRLICLGDVAAGPQATECVERIRSLGCPVVLGNWDAWFVDGVPTEERELERKIAEIGRWWSDGISDEDRAFISSFASTLDVDLGDGKALHCFHGSPSSFNDIILSTTSEASLERMLDGRSAAVYAGGHTHVQMVRRLRSALVVNPGSVGLPFRRWRPEVICVAPWAEYGLVSSSNGRLDVELRRTTYDVEAFLKLSADSGMPHADWWLDTWVLT
jgi:predicted phosphodiesterase